MTYKQGDCYARTHWYSASVVFFEDTYDEVEIECTIYESWDENTDYTNVQISVNNVHEIPEGYIEQDIIDFVTENFE